MASWKRFFNTPAPGLSNGLVSKGYGGNNQASPQISNFSSGLKDIYSGAVNRLSRYDQYDILDRDPVVNSALNIIAEFCCQENEFNNLPFVVDFKSETNEIETEVLKQTLDKWCYINDFRTRLFYMWRNTLKYGDTFYIRDPETLEWIYVDPRNVEKIVIDDSNDGKKPYSYVIRNVSAVLANKVMTNSPNTGMYTSGANTSTPGQYSTQSSINANTYAKTLEIPAKHVIQLSLNSGGLDTANWPFGTSILETVYKPAKQKELLEDAYLIYKIQRAPMRRVFYIYTGDLQSNKAMAFVERVKNEMHQRRLPSRDGGSGMSIVDSTYDPQSLNEDFYLPRNAEGQGPTIDVLQGGGDLASGDGDLLDYFNKNVITGLGIPTSYIQTATMDNQQPYNDGKVGVALMQEWRFAQMCLRLQKMLRTVFDVEFKIFCKKRGVAIMASEFSIELEEPQSFSDYRQMEKDSTMFSNLAQANSIPHLSKRFALKRFGNFTEEELIENERLWKEENKSKIKGKVADIELTSVDDDLSLNNVGIKKGNLQDEDDDLDVDIEDDQTEDLENEIN